MNSRKRYRTPSEFAELIENSEWIREKIINSKWIYKGHCQLKIKSEFAITIVNWKWIHESDSEFKGNSKYIGNSE